MPKVKRVGEELALIFSSQEARELNLSEGMELQACKARDNLFVLEAKAGEKKGKPLEERVLELLESTPFSDRVEGRFEKMLSAESLQVFKQLMEQKEIVRFKSSPQYQKAVYRTQRELNNPTPPPAQEKPKEKVDVSKLELSKTLPNIEDYSLQKHGFVVIKNELRARNLSLQLKSQITSGEVKGIKSFEGVFYIMKSPLFDHVCEKFLPYFKEKREAAVDELAQKFSFGKDLVKGSCEFLKEEGELSEKRKDFFKYIES
jgi:hypothetical protein